MRIEYTTRIEIAERAPELPPAEHERLIALFNWAIEREI
jgi:hypothetical protein